MTKPAAFFLQLIGAIMALSGFGVMVENTLGGALIAAIGILLMVVAGRAVRKRININAANDS